LQNITIRVKRVSNFNADKTPNETNKFFRGRIILNNLNNEKINYKFSKFQKCIIM